MSSGPLKATFGAHRHTATLDDTSYSATFGAHRHTATITEPFTIPAGGNALLLESGSYLLLESGDHILLEAA